MAHPRPEPWFSPFDALGLPPGQYSDSMVSQAFRRASRHCHPDNQSRSAAAAKNRWPSQNDLNTAQAYLVENLQQQGAVINAFRSFPRTFFPTEKLGSPQVYREPSLSTLSGLSRCRKCHMVLKTCHLQDHLDTDHPSWPCVFCGPVDSPSLVAHYQAEHADKFCVACDKPLLSLGPGESKETHMKQEHSCYICDQALVVGNTSLAEHLVKCHSLRPCSQSCILHDQQARERSGAGLAEHICLRHGLPVLCPVCGGSHFEEERGAHLASAHLTELCSDCAPDCPGWDDHIRESHIHAECPRCLVRIMDDKLWSHMKAKHGFKQCSRCAKSVGEFAANVSHFDALHISQYCHDCRQTLIGWEYYRHMVSKHGWVECHYCPEDRPRVDPPDAHDEHLSMDHTFAECEVCGEPVESSQRASHLMIDHSWAECYFCDLIVAGTEELRQHILCNHNQTEPCPACQSLQTVEGLRYHLVESHAWVQCPYCREAQAAESLERHVEQHGLEECGLCQELHPGREMASHLSGRHHFKQCPFCPDLHAEDALKQHMVDAHAVGSGTRAGEPSGHDNNAADYSHEIEECRVCHMPHPKDEMMSHLFDHHSFKQCPFCPAVDTEDALKQHMTEVHFPSHQDHDDSPRRGVDSPAPDADKDGGPAIGPSTPNRGSTERSPAPREAAAAEEEETASPTSAGVRRCLTPGCNFTGNRAQLAQHQRQSHRRPGESPSIKGKQVPCPYDGCDYVGDKSNMPRHKRKHRETDS